MAKTKKPSKSRPPKARNFLLEGFDLPRLEEKVLEFWKSSNIFEKSLAKRSRSKTFVFYEGPPGANGRPGTHHILPRVYKDIICRYKTMRGFFVPRKSGWDTHGLPVEIAAEKELGLKSKKDIEAYGIAAFNKKCRELVWQYKAEWEKLTDRIGFWLDLKDPYVTYEADYIESLWWIVKQFTKKGLVSKGHKVVPWCYRCGTALSSHEVAQGYKEVWDRSVFVKFKLLPGQKIGEWEVPENTYILSWTTTPWTLPGNVALAVGSEIKYTVTNPLRIVEIGNDKINGLEDELWIYASETSANLQTGQDQKAQRVEKEIFGKDLVGLRYEPLFDIPQLQNEKSYRVYAADFVTTTDGTGVVHTAVMYGEDDYNLGVSLGLAQFHTVTEEGRFKAEIPVVGGMIVKAKDGGSKETEDKIFEHLKAKNNFLREHSYKHEYPHCWRCDTPLLYYARTSWFVGVSGKRKELVKNNQKINWVPGHFKQGRFGEWLREAKDWNFSRERYWGTPFPIWECAECGNFEAIGSLDELEEKMPPMKNTYWIMRHGESETNVFNIIDSGQGRYGLTPKGKRQAEAAGKKLADMLKKEHKQIDLIVSSPIKRTRDTAEIVQKVLKVPQLEFEDQLYEIHLGELAGCHDSRYHELFPTYTDKFERAPKGGETLRDLRARMWRSLRSFEEEYEGKNILIVSHDYPLWMLVSSALGWSEKKTIAEKENRGDDFMRHAQVWPLPVRSLPRNDQGEVDLHRPYVDAPSYPCARCRKGTMERVKSVVDVWYDSGAMPFAQHHYPFENKNLIEKGTRYPAEYICEAVDQTRGWFYTLLAVSTLLDRGPSFENVVCLGHINDKQGKKMSKSRGNIIDPWLLIEKHGIDAIRWHFFTGTPVGEPMSFDETDITKAFRRFHSLIYNSLVFYETYGAKSAKPKEGSSNPLDQWILLRLNQTTAAATSALDRYDIRGAALALEGLADDLSRWYIRRSRRRFQKVTDEKDHASASATLSFVLRELAKLTAPFTPFFSEAVYHALGPSEESVHCELWPVASRKGSPKLIKDMAEIRSLASIGLAKRAEAGVKVRQPLASLTVKALGVKSSDLLDILREEVNVKNVLVNDKLSSDAELDTTLTPELIEEGVIREIVRTVQELRQKAACHPRDRIALMLELPERTTNILQRNEKLLRQEVGAKEVQYFRSGKFTAELETRLLDEPAWLAVRKI
jgi:isoleucyl-tRNA synthetase